ncbi:Molecular chaperone (DnaJ superfamily) [Lithohypha guttulata]|uniref:Molecular chaperone (DnaJ superfamily) n=1 Tax=Lithohypha guttulata TaxID=1690604 RepID=A0AAN7Y8W0_9EURO|nr:Molecular chaperone (DnaJ superfamily) [Lithohypha guttulata]
MSIGIGVGDLVLACHAIYDFGKRYKDAPEEFRELGDKANSLEMTLQRIQLEDCYQGSILRKANNAAEAQIQTILKPLRVDLQALKDLVEKYKSISADGYGRRLIFAFKESGELVDLRRKISHHEQSLQMWYMTVIVSSLTRIEGGIEEIHKMFKTIRQQEPMIRAKILQRAASTSSADYRMSSHPPARTWHRTKTGPVPDRLNDEEVKPLKEALLKAGVSRSTIDNNLEDAIKYLFAEPEKKDVIEVEVERRTTTLRDPESMDYRSRPSHQQYSKSQSPPTIKLSHEPRYDISYHKQPTGGLRRSRSANDPHKASHDTNYEARSPKLYSKPHNQSNIRFEPRDNDDVVFLLDNRAHSGSPKLSDVLEREQPHRRPAVVFTEKQDRDYLVIEDHGTRRRASSPSHHRAYSDSSRSGIEIRQLRPPRIERSVSPRPGVTHYRVGE